MRRADLVLRNGRLVTPLGELPAGLAVRDGRIAAVADDDDLPPAEAVIDCRGRVVLPGLVDPHVHMGGEFPFEQNCQTEPRSAAAGGITTILQYRLSADRSFLETFDRYRGVVEASFIVDTAFHFIISGPEQVEEIPEYARRFGVRSFKFYLGGYERDNPIGLRMVDDATLFRAMELIRDLGPYAYCMVHAEHDALVSALTRRVKASGRRDGAAYSEARPAFCEELDIARAIWLAELTGCPLYVVHTSVGRGVDLAAEARLRGVQVVLETCPHYLALTYDDRRLASLGPGYSKVSPPLRRAADQERLWWGLRNGLVQTVGSDHVPLLKRGTDVWGERPGFAGLATVLPVLLSEGVHRGRISLEKVAEVCSYNPARLFGLYPQKGAIQVGADADLVVVDLEREAEVNEETTLSRYSSAFQGMKLKGWPVTTIRRGEVIFDEGEIRAAPGSGRLLRPGAAAAAAPGLA